MNSHDSSPQLESLILHSNSISRIEGLSKLQKLSTLRLDQNAIGFLEGLEQNSRLTYLNLSHNRVSKIGVSCRCVH